MRFFIREKEIGFDEFKELCPKEAAALDGHLEIAADFELDQNKALFLRSPHSSPVTLDLSARMEYHRKFFHKQSIYSQPLGKALGLKKGKPKPKVLDATAGTLKDSCLILSMGMEVLACERHPVPQALIINALARWKPANLAFIGSSALEAAKTYEDWDVIYFDPMYEAPNAKAAPKKEMRIFREVVKQDSDAKEKAEELLNFGKRLVIKRSVKASPLLPDPAHSFGKKSTVYDVYL